LSSELQSEPDILGLRALVATCKQNDQLSTPSLEVDSVTGAIIDPHLRYAFSYSSDLTRISSSQTLYPDLNPGSPPRVIEAIKPFRKHRCFANLDQDAKGSQLATACQFAALDLVFTRELCS
jgi:hypothetical protein